MDDNATSRPSGTFAHTAPSESIVDRTREFRDRFSGIYVADASWSREFGASAAPESGAGDEVIMSIAGHVSRAMLSGTPTSG